MFEYFASNYVWNLSVNLAIGMGASMGEVDEACRPIRDAGARGEDAGTERFLASWSAVGDRLAKLAQGDEELGRLLSAGEKYGRAAVFYMTAERMQNRHFEPRKKLYALMLDCFGKYLKLTKQPASRVEVAYRSGAMPSYFYPAAGVLSGNRAPCMIFLNGLDSIKEMVYRCGFAQALSRRGISTLIVDQPGAGEALRLHGLTAVIETEQWVSVLVDYLQARPDVDPHRIGLMGWSMAGYYVPRATAFEPRLNLCAVLGANYDWYEVNLQRVAKEAQNPVPHYWDHVNWVWGTTSRDEFLEYCKGITLKGILDRIKVPALIVHGENDRQISKDQAHLQYQALINSPKRELKITRVEDGGIEHCSADGMDNARDYMADWIAETMGTQTR